MGITVCKGCTERQVKCHCTCERYKQQRMALDEENKLKEQSMLFGAINREAKNRRSKRYKSTILTTHKYRT